MCGMQDMGRTNSRVLSFTHITNCPYWEAMKEMNLFGNGRIAKGGKKGNSLLQSYFGNQSISHVASTT
jgi:hypothetical protein